MLLVALVFIFSTVGAYAMEVPEEAYTQNLNGIQQYIKVYTVSPEVVAEDLIEEPFNHEGFFYEYSKIVKEENRRDSVKEYEETVRIETTSKDLNKILEELPSTMEYSKDGYKGTLHLNHKTINTEASSYRNVSYKVNTTKEIPNLDDCDMSYVPLSCQKDGQTLKLTSCDWQVQGTDLVDDVLVPSSYKAVATYETAASKSVVSGYITTAIYEGEISSDEVESITYTVTYEGKTGGVLSSTAGKIGALLFLIAFALGFGVLLPMHLVRKDKEREAKRQEEKQESIVQTDESGEEGGESKWEEERYF